MFWTVDKNGVWTGVSWSSLRQAQIYAQTLKEMGNEVKVYECYPSGKKKDITESLIGEPKEPTRQTLNIELLRGCDKQILIDHTGTVSITLYDVDIDSMIWALECVKSKGIEFTTTEAIQFKVI